MFGLDIDLTDLETRGNVESQRLKETLERIGNANSNAKQIIERVRADYNFTPFQNPVDLNSGLDRALDDILHSAPDGSDDPE